MTRWAFILVIAGLAGCDEPKTAQEQPPPRTAAPQLTTDQMTVMVLTKKMATLQDTVDNGFAAMGDFFIHLTTTGDLSPDEKATENTSVGAGMKAALDAIQEALQLQPPRAQNLQVQQAIDRIVLDFHAWAKAEQGRVAALEPLDIDRAKAQNLKSGHLADVLVSDMRTAFAAAGLPLTN